MWQTVNILNTKHLTFTLTLTTSLDSSPKKPAFDMVTQQRSIPFSPFHVIKTTDDHDPAGSTDDHPIFKDAAKTRKWPIRSIKY